MSVFTLGSGLLRCRKPLRIAYSFINYRWIKLPLTIAQLLLSLGLAVLVLVAKPLWPAAYGFLSNTVTQVDFNHFMLDILLGFLLFAGALHVDIRGLEEERWPVFYKVINLRLISPLSNGRVSLNDFVGNPSVPLPPFSS